ncbi:MAG: hypothetical protein LBQ91_06670, partial [Oscillospiraceae bacterium]|nr:hypothetical protein [Oscillospiraceae bacterium]
MDNAITKTPGEMDELSDELDEVLSIPGIFSESMRVDYAESLTPADFLEIEQAVNEQNDQVFLKEPVLRLLLAGKVTGSVKSADILALR